MTRAFLIGALATGATLFATPTLAEEFRCTGAVGPVSLDNVFVPDGASCVLDRTRMNGSVVVGRGPSLQATSVSINGNLQSESHTSAISATGNIIGGNLQAFQNMGGASFINNRMNGNMQCKENIPAPTGSGNQSPSKEDQCAGL